MILDSMGLVSLYFLVAILMFMLMMLVNTLRGGQERGHDVGLAISLLWPLVLPGLVIFGLIQLVEIIIKWERSR